ncbi:hypothetical protein SAMN06265222_108116 [Neorhodopirellula lusitana]|uniref:Secreted protein n=1 Tax=Neorhodopirellula lusitana TaxID=445327 RepID=A0ABY1Q930_9BACT|nr:hypothetical protein [Neorhodopirellula lusitana]SMP63607.1 hypothetical protein SAMN06265222_108116 [Neorhodopirellula lusitana]
MNLIKLFLLASCLIVAVGCGEPTAENVMDGANETQLAEIRAELEAQQKERESSTDRPSQPGS